MSNNFYKRKSPKRDKLDQRRKSQWRDLCKTWWGPDPIPEPSKAQRRRKLKRKRRRKMVRKSRQRNRGS